MAFIQHLCICAAVEALHILSEHLGELVECNSSCRALYNIAAEAARWQVAARQQEVR